MYYYDLTYIVLIPAIIFTFWAQAKVNSAFKKYSSVRNSTGLTGFDAARKMLDANGLYDVPINVIGGNALTNYYDPRNKTLNLSSEVYSQPSIAAICIACHEAGHAVQDAEHYPALNFRNAIVPVVNIAQTISWPIIIIGLLLTTQTMYGTALFNLGVICFVAVILFHLVTLPVEFNASARALEGMQSLSIVNDADYRGSKKVLSAAAMTYVAALAVAVANLLRILLIARRD
ncbi:MAG: zinc metallopeptidase [Firmicutes bacterium]|nr:zinc metallopeptidase [Bacillota bacterium]